MSYFGVKLIQEYSNYVSTIWESMDVLLINTNYTKLYIYFECWLMHMITSSIIILEHQVMVNIYQAA